MSSFRHVLLSKLSYSGLGLRGRRRLITNAGSRGLNIPLIPTRKQVAEKTLNLFETTFSKYLSDIPSLYLFKSLSREYNGGYKFAICYSVNDDHLRHSLIELPESFRSSCGTYSYPIFIHELPGACITTSGTQVLSGRDFTEMEVVGDRTLGHWMKHIPGLYSYGIEIDYDRYNFSFENTGKYETIFKFTINGQPQSMELIPNSIHGIKVIKNTQYDGNIFVSSIKSKPKQRISVQKAAEQNKYGLRYWTVKNHFNEGITDDNLDNYDLEGGTITTNVVDSLQNKKLLSVGHTFTAEIGKLFEPQTIPKYCWNRGREVTWNIDGFSDLLNTTKPEPIDFEIGPPFASLSKAYTGIDLDYSLLDWLDTTAQNQFEDNVLTFDGVDKWPTNHIVMGCGGEEKKLQFKGVRKNIDVEDNRFDRMYYYHSSKHIKPGNSGSPIFNKQTNKIQSYLIGSTHNHLDVYAAGVQDVFQTLDLTLG